MATFICDSKVNSSNRRLDVISGVPASIKKLVGRTVESSGSNATGRFVAWPSNGLIGAVHHAYNSHLPLVLRPDDIWLAIAQGFALHMAAGNNAEALRRQFVEHEGKAILSVRRDDFVKGRDNPWPDVFAEFSSQIAAYIGKKHDLLVADFSTTGSVEKAASEIVLMDVMQSYFKYEFYTRCGIPEITLLGTSEDWRAVRKRAGSLAEFDLGWWTEHLLPVLDQFVAAASGRVDDSFWTLFYKDTDGSGSPHVTGWINVLFPYIDKPDYGTRNEGMKRWRNGFGKEWGSGAPTGEAFPSGISKAPFTWLYYDQRFKMEFLGGFVGVSQDEVTGALSPVIGWGVCEA